MPELLLRGTRIRSIFQLLGERENDLTYSLAWALSQSPQFLKALIQSAIQSPPTPEHVTIRLQHSEAGAGITDVEIESPGEFFLLIEAKRGWNLPSIEQLAKYARRRAFSTGQHAARKILVLSECSAAYAKSHLATLNISGIEIAPVSWKFVADAPEAAKHRPEFIVLYGIGQREKLGEDC